MTNNWIFTAARTALINPALGVIPPSLSPLHNSMRSAPPLAAAIADSTESTQISSSMITASHKSQRIHHSHWNIVSVHPNLVSEQGVIRVFSRKRDGALGNTQDLCGRLHALVNPSSESPPGTVTFSISLDQQTPRRPNGGEAYHLTGLPAQRFTIFCNRGSSHNAANVWSV